jgi:gas vesicle protein
MHRRVYLTALSVGLCAVLISAAPIAAQTSTGTTDKSASTTDKITSYSVEKKKEAVAYGKKLMSDFDKQIKELEGQIARDTSAAKADAQRQLKDLKAQRAETGKKLDELGRASAQSWDSMKHGFAEAYKDLQQSYDKAVASFKK